MERSKKKKGEDGDERKRLRKREDFTHALLLPDNHMSLCEFQTQSACTYTHTQAHAVYLNWLHN